jgi:hypothetical protein
LVLGFPFGFLEERLFSTPRLTDVHSVERAGGFWRCRIAIESSARSAFKAFKHRATAAAIGIDGEGPARCCERNIESAGLLGNECMCQLGVVALWESRSGKFRN